MLGIIDQHELTCALGIKLGGVIVAAKQTIDFKDPLWITKWLDTALKKEKEKYAKCPVPADMVPGCEVAHGWGYVVTGYFLVEESFKALLYVRGKKSVPTKHSLSSLFNLLNCDDKTVLREYYADYKATIGGVRAAFPFDSLDDFLANLDGDENKRGDDHIGSFDWRYFLIAENRSQKMPFVSIDYLHEIAFGCTRILEHANNGRLEPSRCTHSWRMQWDRRRKYHDWLTVRMNSAGWNGLGDRLEILWGPDYLGRYDLYLFKGKGRQEYLSDIPADLELPVVDKRKEIDAFDIEQGYRSIGVIRHSFPSEG